MWPHPRRLSLFFFGPSLIACRGHIPVSIYGTPSRAEVIQHYAELGVERCIFWLPPAPGEQILPLLDSYAELVNSFA